MERISSADEKQLWQRYFMTFYFFSISFMFSFSQEDGDPGLVAFICSGLGEIKESDFMHPSVFNDFMAGIFCIFPIK